MVIVYTNFTLFDAKSGNMVENQSLVAEKGSITYAGDTGGYTPTTEDVVHDLGGKTVLPGLMDLHVHIGSPFTGGHDERHYLRTKSDQRHYYALSHAYSYLKAGFTTIRDVGSGGKWAPALRRSIDQGIISGPRLQVAGWMGQWGDQERMGPDELLRGSRDSSEVMTGTEGVMHMVRDKKADGFDMIKTATTGGVLHGMESKVERSLWRSEELEAMVDEAERLGMYVAAHAHGDAGIQAALRAGVRTIEHGSLMSEESMKLILEKGHYLVPTHSAPNLIKRPEVRNHLPPDVVERGDYVTKMAIQQHRIAFERGVKIALGTDAPVGGQHCHSAEELELMVTQVGMTPTQALQSATVVAAEAIRRDDLGVLEVGRLADLVVVNGDPTQDITIMQDLAVIEMVVKGGQIVVKNGVLGV
ncbi:MAG: amidohydrolase family protein [Candidatus Kariarchaeaceae archaeon]|jgi:imidazolonepropionase-like amidohydrolase